MAELPTRTPIVKNIVVDDSGSRPCENVTDCISQLNFYLNLNKSRYNFILGGEDLIFECRSFDNYEDSWKREYKSNVIN